MLLFISQTSGEINVRIDDTTGGTSVKKADLQVFPDSPRKISLVPNRKYEIECSFSAAFNNDQDGWKKDDSPVPLANEGQPLSEGASVVVSLHTRTLVFNNFTAGLAGLYQCVYPGGVRELQIGVCKCIQSRIQIHKIISFSSHAILISYDSPYWRFLSQQPIQQ